MRFQINSGVRTPRQNLAGIHVYLSSSRRRFHIKVSMERRLALIEYDQMIAALLSDQAYAEPGARRFHRHGRGGCLSDALK
jgi:hypothetical protein